MRNHAPNPTKFRPHNRFLLPYHFDRPIPGTHISPMITERNPGQVLKSADGKTRYQVLDNGSIRRLDGRDFPSRKTMRPGFTLNVNFVPA